MQLNELFTCPLCNNKNAELNTSTAILSDIRMDEFRCNTCGAVWRSYSRIVEYSKEIMFTPDTAEPSTASEEELVK